MDTTDPVPGIWITAVPPFGPEETGVLLAVDTTSADPGEQAVSALLGYGHEGEEGVFHLLPSDLSARCTRTPGRLAVTLFTSRAVLTRHFAEHPALLAHFTGDDEWVPLLRRALATDSAGPDSGPDSGPDGEPRAVLLIDHPGPAASPAELIAAFDAGEAGIAVLGVQ
ncbi:hypothetical protein [Kitasatospora sp. NPDC057198]|uniref:hypothetical protein n=1 Tax=Kitasatospora sp. NPDC057198 TaxID=3346046 RepID=UPI003625AAF7